MYNNVHQSDVVIRCGNREIHAHKALLMARSGLFYTAFSSKFPVAHAGTYKIEGHEPELVDCMIRFICDAPLDEAYKAASGSLHNRALRLFMITNEYQVPEMGRVLTRYLVDYCDGHVKRLRRILGQVAALYQDHVIADRSLINGVAALLRTEHCRILTRSVPEVLEILYVQRTTRLGFRSSTATSTLFPPVSMADYLLRDLKGELYDPVFGRKLKKPPVALPNRPFRSKKSERR
ncbi:hypothetical protein M436DRAFT_60297 [Aureobasidium namibiae CBS 147.97]|uniref:BTB domain-containing protein n=1 Tax=Aureobasidium namibiae CBS 147.97 TaxID=1043004 RepID=A0A074WY63_9PEZI|nr:uncharacterized protein M436DRAFT_60297 [Aureobasidium namibiae CBS 147.97]KEQ76464.1 hypothetical protein M436DRAFT_60297 [Aureobasidium namibiae CBS 147.97]